MWGQTDVTNSERVEQREFLLEERTEKVNGLEDKCVYDKKSHIISNCYKKHSSKEGPMSGYYIHFEFSSRVRREPALISVFGPDAVCLLDFLVLPFSHLCVCVSLSFFI